MSAALLAGSEPGRGASARGCRLRPGGAEQRSGGYVRSHRAYAAELERQNRLLQQAQGELAARAVTEERLRIARELHDVVAHTMSVVAVHAGTGRMVARDEPAAAQEALATIETATRSALGEMRGLLGVLRDDGPGPSGSVVHTYGTFSSALRRGAGCAELFDQRARFDNPATLAKIDADLQRIGCTSSEATRVP